MTNKTKREAKFIGNLFVNTSKAGKTYARGTIEINGETINVFGHFNSRPSKKDPNIIVDMISLEDTTEADALNQAERLKLDDSAAKGKAKKQFKLEF